MAVDEKLLAEALQAAQRISQAQRAVNEARAGFERAVRALYLEGGSMREIADLLGISHQRVHQLLDLPKAPVGWRPGSGRGSRAAAFECQFCGRSQQQVRKLIMGKGTAVCNACATLGHKLLQDGTAKVLDNAHVALAVKDGPGRCGFCDKRTGVPDALLRGQKLPLVVATTAAGRICAECLDLAVEIISEELDS